MIDPLFKLQRQVWHFLPVAKVPSCEYLFWFFFVFSLREVFFGRLLPHYLENSLKLTWGLAFRESSGGYNTVTPVVGGNFDGNNTF